MSTGISPGLLKTSQLLKDVHLPWRAIHVAGTNGKGSTCAYLAAMLKAANVRVGRFSSPHLRYRWDGITIDEKTVQKSLFAEIETNVKERNIRLNIAASSFEILTVTAFEVFKRHEVDVAVIECGMGGRLDATNVVTDPLVSVITNIDLDHQDFLGTTVSEIASHKAGIIKPGAPCVVSSQNSTEAIEVVRQEAAARNIRVEIAQDIDVEMPRLGESINISSLSSTQRHNMGCALCALKMALQRLPTTTNVQFGDLAKLSTSEQCQTLAPAMLNTQVPGRYQQINAKQFRGRRASILIDGAHNPQAWQLLRDHVNKTMRSSATAVPVMWLMAQSQSKHKSFQAMIETLCRSGDKVVTCEFNPVDGMSWVRPVDAYSVSHMGKSGVEIIGSFGRHELREAVQKAVSVAREGPLVVTGSLYLVSDVLALIDDV